MDGIGGFDDAVPLAVAVGHLNSFLPGKNGVEVAAFFVGAEVGERFVLTVAPAIGDGIEVGVALEGLKDHAGAVVEVGGEHERRVEAKTLTPVIVVIKHQGLPQRVEAVDLVEHVQLDHVMAIQSPVVWWNDGFVWVLAEPDDVLACDWVDANIGDALPSSVDFRAWRKAVDVRGVRFVVEESCIVLSGNEWDIETVKDRCWKDVITFSYLQ